MNRTLVQAVLKNDVRLTRLALRNGADEALSIQHFRHPQLNPLEQIRGMGFSSSTLMVAAFLGNDAVIDVLFSHNAALLRQQNQTRHTPLMYAILGKKPHTVRLLLKHGAEPNRPNRYDQNALQLLTNTLLSDSIYNITAMDVDILETLLDAKASTDVTDFEGWSPLLKMTARLKTIIPTHRAYLKKKKHIKRFYSKLKLASSPLTAFDHAMICVRLDDIPCLNRLFVTFDIDQQNTVGRTLLHESIWDSRLRITKSLMEKGARPTLRDRNGNTPLHLVAADGQAQTAIFLMKYGAKADAQNSNGETPLMLAIKRLSRPNDTRVLAVLLSSMSHVNQKNNNGETALFIAVDNEVIPSLRLLLKHGADPNLVTNKGYTPLMRAVYRLEGQTTAARLLIAEGAKLNSKNADDQTAVDIADNQCDLKHLKYLVRKGGRYSALYKPKHRKMRRWSRKAWLRWYSEFDRRCTVPSDN